MGVSAKRLMIGSSIRWGWAYVIKTTEENDGKMVWKTSVEVAKVLPNDATITQAKTFAAVESAKAICCLVRTGSISFDLYGHLIEEL